eukprot:9688279-Karenia_brevis.AAC.1
MLLKGQCNSTLVSKLLKQEEAERQRQMYASGLWQHRFNRKEKKERRRSEKACKNKRSMKWKK